MGILNIKIDEALRHDYRILCAKLDSNMRETTIQLIRGAVEKQKAQEQKVAGKEAGK